MRSVVLLTGACGSGKTTVALRLARELAAAGLRVGGVAQPAVVEWGARVGYELLDVASGDRRPLARRATVPPAPACGFEFEPDAWGWAAARLRGARRDCDVLVADELGWIEAAGEGHLPALTDRVGTERARLWLLAVRAEVVATLARRLGPVALLVEPAADLDAVGARLRALVGALPAPPEDRPSEG